MQEIEVDALSLSFNTQPPEGGCEYTTGAINGIARPVSTHSRPKAAAINDFIANGKTLVSTHSRPKAAAAGE